MRPQAVSIQAAAQRLATTAVNILVCDTCALLDIIRLPIRAENASKLSATMTAVSAIQSLVFSNQVAIVCPPPVPGEWQNHAATLRSETEQHITKTELEYLKIRASATSHGTAMPAVSFPAQLIAQHLYDLSNGLIDASIILSKESTPSLRANDRAASYTAPASRGTIKDCIIYEHMIELFDALPPASPSATRILLTSNTNDFCDSGAHPKPPLDSELAARGVKLCTQWPWAHRELLVARPTVTVS